MHRYFGEDIVGDTIGLLFKKASEPGGLCDQYMAHKDDVPVEVSIPVLPFVSMKTETVCKALQQSRCPND
jgi:hypothetical protein